MIDEDDVRRISELAGLAISKKQLPDVTAQLQRIAEIAQSLDAVELDPCTDELAPVWRP